MQNGTFSCILDAFVQSIKILFENLNEKLCFWEKIDKCPNKYVAYCCLMAKNSQRPLQFRLLCWELVSCLKGGVTFSKYICKMTILHVVLKTIDHCQLYWRAAPKIFEFLTDLFGKKWSSRPSPRGKKFMTLPMRQKVHDPPCWKFKMFMTLPIQKVKCSWPSLVFSRPPGWCK